MKFKASRPRQARRASLSFAVLYLIPAVAYAQTTGFLRTDGGPYDYNATENWVAADINGIWDSSLTLTDHQAATFAEDTILATALTFAYAGNHDVTLRSDGSAARTLTLGGDISVSPASNRIVNFGSVSADMALDVDLAGDRKFIIQASKALNFFNTISGGNLGVYGTSPTAAGGTFRLSRAAASASGVNLTVGDNATFQIDNSPNGNLGNTRANSLTLISGGKLSVRGNSTDTVETITGNLTTDGSGARPKYSANNYHSVSLDAGGGHTLLSVGGITRTNKGTLLFRGDNLGTNSIASATGGSSNLQLTGGAPAMIGGGGTAGSTTISIVPWMVGGPGLGDSGTTFVTHDATNGLRPLDFSTEFVSSIGGNPTDNVRLTAGADTAISGNQTVNSLILGTPGSSISGTDPSDTLTVTSGAILISRTTGTATPIDVNLDFGTAEGLIGFLRGEKVNGTIAGSGGLTIHGNRNDESLQLLNGGNTYTGDTTILSNAMVVAGSLPHGGRTGDVYVYGNLQLNTAGYTGTINGLFGTGIVAYGNSGASSLTIGDNNATSTFAGSIIANEKLSIIKTGTGTLTLAGANDYLGNTSVNDGTLQLATTGSLKFKPATTGASNKVTGSAAADFDGTFNLDLSSVASLTEENQWTLVDGVSPGYDAGTFNVTSSLGAFTEPTPGVHRLIDGSNTWTYTESTGLLTLSVATGDGYSDWASTNAGGQDPDEDFDDDGVSNGVEYFMNAAPGLTTLPGIVGGAVTWTNGGNIAPNAYGTEFLVQTSDNLVDWDDVDESDGNLENDGSGVSYTLPTGETKFFVRLQVTPQ
jgi:autotransporter-associated beta strand protein